MKYIILLSLIIPVASFTMDGLYQLPTAKIIKERLECAELKKFACYSNIADDLGDRLFKPIYLHQYVNSQIQKYNSAIKEWNYQNFELRVHSKQPTVAILMNLLLQDYPRALTALENNYDGAFLK